MRVKVAIFRLSQTENNILPQKAQVVQAGDHESMML